MSGEYTVICHPLARYSIQNPLSNARPLISRNKREGKYMGYAMDGINTKKPGHVRVGGKWNFSFISLKEWNKLTPQSEVAAIKERIRVGRAIPPDVNEYDAGEIMADMWKVP